ncbi:flap endonuclease-1 [archaeon]|jgi:flap endonuclease-1|nr:flap endonuclease-1 [archaeon]MBT4023105.1 flap endonuclease-1 [archaeon]MBT4272503.1 flap endonuclease-1 [archaeon]MBT4460601.1 flap endonuclease-1 [archaeon]MBT4857809.1 flap endonuclease-1 [archaeon]
MGTKLGPIIESQEIEIGDLSGKTFVIDAFNILYQFLTTIRQYDGSFLTDSNGNITSHLSGLFFRTTNLMKQNLKLAFVFDGIAPELKKKERDRRKSVKQEAQRKYDLAVEKGDIELMKKYASRTAKLTSEQIDESKELIKALGLPIIQAPSEGEAQAAYMVKKGDAYGLISQDTDGLMFGSPKLIKNLSISKKRKQGATYVKVGPELIDLSSNLNKLGLDIDQLIVLGILCGTDFNIGGIKGIGPKKGLTLLKKHNQNFEELFRETGWEFPYSWQKVFDTIKNMPISKEYDLIWKSVDSNKIRELLIKNHDFSEQRVEKVLEELTKKQAQKGLSEFF